MLLRNQNNSFSNNKNLKKTFFPRKILLQFCVKTGHVAGPMWPATDYSHMIVNPVQSVQNITMTILFLHSCKLIFDCVLFHTSNIRTGCGIASLLVVPIQHTTQAPNFFLSLPVTGHVCTSDRKPTNPKLGWKFLGSSEKNLGRCGDWTHDPIITDDVLYHWAKQPHFREQGVKALRTNLHRRNKTGEKKNCGPWEVRTLGLPYAERALFHWAKSPTIMMLL